MAKMTIAQLREKDIESLANDYMNGDIETARKFFNSFYRLSGLEQRLLIMENDGDYYARHAAYIEKESDRAYQWAVRLRKLLNKYGLSLEVSGGYPKVVKTYEDTTGISVIYYGHYYN